MASKKISPACAECRKQKRERTTVLVERVIERVEEKLEKAEIKPTVADYLRLLQFREEMTQEEQPREIKVTWVESEMKSETESEMESENEA